MKLLLLSLAVTAALLLPAAAAPAQSKSGKMHARHIFVSVTDAKGAPVEGLSVADFKISEAGEPRVVSKVGPA
jgi:hypothetical protein